MSASIHPEFNPYEPPRADVRPERGPDYLPGSKFSGAVGAWREGDLLLMSEGASLPDNCVKCDEPAEGYLLKRNLQWHHPAVYLLILIHLLLYIIVALIVRKRVKVYIPVCEAHRRRRVNAIITAWTLVVSSIAVPILIGVNSQAWFAESGSGVVGVTSIVGVVVFIAAAMYGALVGRVVAVKRIEEKYAWIRGVCPEFLARLKDSGKSVDFGEL
jgi:hypothetical protein